MKIYQILRNITGTVVFETELQSVLKVEIKRMDLDFEKYSILTTEKSEQDIAFERMDELSEDIYGWEMEIENIRGKLNAARAERCQLQSDHVPGMF